MIKLIFMMVRRPGISKGEFRTRYESMHVKLAQRYFGHLLERYVRNYPTFATLNPSNCPAGTQVAACEFEYDAIAEMWLRDSAAVVELTRICNDPNINPILVEDELKFLDRAKTLMLVCEEIDSGVSAERS